MSSYTDNLQSTINSALQSQQLDQKKTLATYNASVFTLYYAQGASFTAAEKLELAENTLNTEKSGVKEQAVHTSNICNNLVASADQANQYMKQTINNTAVCASNVQIAANAIMKLAGNIGGVYSMVNASDFHGPIYKLTEQVYRQINRTAYDAEQASQFAMEASTSAAEVSLTTVNDKAKSVKGVMDNLLNIASTEFDNASETVRAANNTLAMLNAKEKLAEGVLEDVNTNLYSAQSAYNAINSDLNLNLIVPAKTVTDNTFKVSFSLKKSAFRQDSSEVRYPVENYYLIIVNEAKQLNFSLNNAENIVTNTVKDRYVKVTHFTSLPGSAPDLEAATETIRITQVKDSDGLPLSVGTSYVVFVFAQYYLDYKKRLNNFEDFISAPSLPFTMATQLKVADKITPVKPRPETDKSSPKIIHGETKYLTFSITSEENTVEYRCMLLPNDKSISKGLLTKGGLRNLEKEIEQLEIIAAQFDPLIQEYEADYNNALSIVELMTAELEKLEQQRERLIKQAESAPQKEKDKLDAEIAKLTETINKNSEALAAQNNAATTARQQLDEQVEKKKAAIVLINSKEDSKLGFFFDVRLAEQVSAGNYNTQITRLLQTDNQVSTENSSPEAPVDPAGKISAEMFYIVDLAYSTTDNFGNALVPGNSYIPVILSVYNGNDVKSVTSFISGLSDYDKTESFDYYPTTIIK